MSLKPWERWKSAFVLAMGILSVGDVALARPVPDAALGGESSRVSDRSARDFDIDGGARRGGNLFHSFRDFGVDDGGSIYFINPTGVENIFSRVTGAGRSDILGTLGVRGGNANLFLMNPNGILFGPNARLDLNGSFVGTTANAIGFGDEGIFSATLPQVVPEGLLKINPSAFFFNQINPTASIVNQSVAPYPTAPQFVDGLRVDDGLSLLLLGNDIRLQQGSKLVASSGRVELGAVGDAGSVGLTVNGNNLDLIFPADLALGPITALGSVVDASGIQNAGTQGGEIQVQGSQVTLTNSSILSNGYGSQSNGAIALRANQLNLAGSSLVVASTYGAGRAGDVNVVADSIDLVGSLNDQQNVSAIGSEANLGSTGNAGNVTVSTRLLNLQNGARISSSTFGSGQGGNLDVTARESANLSGSVQLANSLTNGSGLFSVTAGSGRAGNLRFSVGQLKIQNGAAVIASTSGAGQAGNVNVIADSIDLVGASDNRENVSAIGSETFAGGTGNSGNVAVSSRLLNISEGASISTSTFGSGQGGNLDVTARESATLSGTVQRANGQISRSALSTGTYGSGRAGNLNLETGRLSVQNGAAVAASTSGSSGRAGDITVTADSIDLAGASADRSLISAIGSQSEINLDTGIAATGNAGNVNVSTRTLKLQDGSTISTGTAGQGRGGDLQVQATESTELSGTATLANGQVFRGGLSTGTFSSGRAGNLNLETGRLSVQNGASISASTTGSSGRAGDVTVNADSIELVGTSADRSLRSGISSQSEINPVTGVVATGDAGNVNVTTRTLRLRDGGVISTNTGGQGTGGNLKVTATESTDLSGTATLATTQVLSGLVTGTTGSGRAGDLNLQTRRLSVQNGALILASTVGSGRAGDIAIDADSIEMAGTLADRFLGSAIGSQSEINSPTGVVATGDAGNVNVTTRTLRLQDGAVISTNTRGSGQRWRPKSDGN